RHLSNHHGAECQDHQKTNNERNPGEFTEIAFEQWPHPNIVIERVDLSEIVTVGCLPTFQLIRIDVQNQSVCVLVRVEAHVPEWEQIRRYQGQHRNKDQNPAL